MNWTIWLQLRTLLSQKKHQSILLVLSIDAPFVVGKDPFTGGLAYAEFALEISL